MNILRIFSVISILTLFATSLSAGVNLKNGNFYISYNDISIPGKNKLEIIRTYNSKSTGQGWFGYGWGSKYETRLHPIGDGTLVMWEHSTGGKTLFYPVTEDPDALSRCIDELIRAMVDDGRLSGPAEILEERQKLRSNGEYRATRWIYYTGKDALYAEHKQGRRWYSLDRGEQEIISEENGFVRTTGSDKEYFNSKGFFTKLLRKNGSWVKMHYNKDGNIAKISTDEGQELKIVMKDGFISEISAKKKKALFEQNSKGYLLKCTDAAKNIYAYTYDDNYNMTGISYEDGSQMQMSYYPSTQFVSAVIERNGDTTKYLYHDFYDSEGNKNDNQYATSVIKNRFGRPDTNYYEYEIRVKEGGDRYTYRILTIVSGVKTETTYNECCGLPLIISRNDRITTFDYNGQGKLLRKASEYEVIKLEYKVPGEDKVTRVEKWNAEETELFSWSKFGYDEMLNLTFAENNDGEWVKLHYNGAGKIEKMECEDKLLLFKYNKIGKPNEISIEGLGKIEVEYDDEGEIKKVNSKDGHAMALQVTQAFQQLLTLVKPSGVNLGM